MRRRRLFLMLTGLAVVICAAGAFVLWPRPNLITQANYDRIHEGMSRTEVYAILGPPGDYASEPSFAGFVRAPELDGITDIWHSDNCAFGLGFDGNGVVCAKKDAECVVIPLGPIDKLRWRARRQWDRWFP